MNTRLAPSRSAASATASAAGRPKVTRSIPVKTISPARMGSAPLDDLLKADGTRVAIAQVFVERPDRGIVGADEQLDLPYAALCSQSSAASMIFRPKPLPWCAGSAAT